MKYNGIPCRDLTHPHPQCPHVEEASFGSCTESTTGAHRAPRVEPHFDYSFLCQCVQVQPTQTHDIRNEMGQYPRSPPRQTCKVNGFSMHGQRLRAIHEAHATGSISLRDVWRHTAIKEPAGRGEQLRSRLIECEKEGLHVNPQLIFKFSQ